jgi:predicted nucleotidyltransferase component of viral defense system
VTEGVDPLHERVAKAALTAAWPYGFVLGGGLALIEHGVLSRPTEDVDLFASGDGAVKEATAAVTTALQQAGFQVTAVEHDSDLDDLIGGMRYHMSELQVAAADGTDREVRVSLGFLDLRRPPVVLDVGPVMALEDLIAWKVAALVNRVEPRDYVDVAVFLAEYSPQELLGRARRVDPALEDDDVADVGRRLDRIPDRLFALYGLGPEQIAGLRARFAAWPR